jgi:hypothetical protein
MPRPTTVYYAIAAGALAFLSLGAYPGATGVAPEPAAISRGAASDLQVSSGSDAAVPPMEIQPKPGFQPAGALRDALDAVAGLGAAFVASQLPDLIGHLGLPARMEPAAAQPPANPATYDAAAAEAALLVRAVSPALTATLAGTEIGFRLRELPLSRLPGQVDSNSPAYWDGGQLIVFSSAERPMRSSGPSLDALGNLTGVACLGCERPGGRWLEAVWPDPASGVLYGWYHFEPSDLPCDTAPIIGAAISYDGGRTWHDQGPVLESGYPIDCDYRNGFFVGGHGDFHVILDAEQRYFYFLFSNYGGPTSEQGIGIARSAFADRGQPGTVFKYYQDAWTEPGLGGRVTPLFPTATGWKGPHVEAFWGPSVHWNDHLQAYVALLNHTDGEQWAQEGVYLALSRDLLHWSEPQKILDSEIWYPQVIGLGPGGTDTRAGQSARLYVGGISIYAIEFE